MGVGVDYNEYIMEEIALAGGGDPLEGLSTVRSMTPSPAIDDAGADLNPLHHSTGTAVRVEDPALLASMERLTARVAGVIDLGFYAIDLIAGAGGLWILELNPNPFCYFYNRTNGRADFVDIYEKLLRKYLL